MRTLVLLSTAAILVGCAPKSIRPDLESVAPQVVGQVPAGNRTADIVQAAFRGAGYGCSPVSTFTVRELEDALLAYDGVVFSDIPTKVAKADSQFAKYRNASNLAVCTRYVETGSTSAVHQIDLLFDSENMLVDASTRSRKD